MTVKLKVKTKDRELVLEVDPSQPDLIHLLDSPEVEFPFGCRGASCAICRAKIVSGGELLEEHTLTEEDTLKRCDTFGTHRLMCRARIKPNSQGEISIIAEDSED